MTETELAPIDHRRLIDIADDLSTYTETLALIEARLADPALIDAAEREALTVDLLHVSASIKTLGRQVANKTDAVAAVLRRLVNEQELITAERQRLKRREAAAERAEQWLRGYVLSVMRNQGATQLKTATNTLSIRGSESVEVTDLSKVPSEHQVAEVRIPLFLWESMVAELKAHDSRLSMALDCVRVKAEPVLSLVKRAIKAGEAIEGASIKSSDNLVVR